MAPNDRVIWLDIAKGITIILMVIGHTSIPQIVSGWIWAFHMPLFFFASGVCTKFEKDNLWTFACKKFRGIGRPFLIYSAIVVIISWLLQIPLLFSLKGGWGGYALWFVPVLYVALVLGKVYFCLNKGIYRYVYIVLLLSTGWVLSYKNVQLPWNMSVAPYATTLLVMAYSNRDEILHCAWKKWWIVLLSFILLALVPHFWRLDMCYNQILPLIPITLGAIAGSLLVAWLSIGLTRYGRCIATWMAGVGQETFIIIAFSQLTIMVINQNAPMNPIFKYILLVIVLLAIKYLKDWILCAYSKMLER